VAFAAFAGCGSTGSGTGAASTVLPATVVATAVAVVPAVGTTPTTPGCETTGVAARKDNRYANTPGASANAQSLDVYLPIRAAGCPATPIVAYVHGGGFRNGDKAGKVDDKITLFAGEGWAFASVNYRLVGDPSAGPEGASYTRQQDDLADAVAWIVGPAAELNVDPARLRFTGHSAGAFLVALQSTDASLLAARGVDPAAIRCTAPLDTETFDIRNQILAGGNQESSYRGAFGDDPAVWDKASPLRNLDDAEPLPAFRFFTRGVAIRETGNRELAAAIQAAGGTASVVVVEPYSHEEVNEAVGKPGDTIVTPPLMDFFRSCV